MKNSVKWVAELAHVREVSLLGTADLSFWKDRLLQQNLLPAERDGRAQIMIVAAESKYMGIPFRELSFSVLVSQQEQGDWQNAAYLLRAFNSNRVFAFCERAFFSTPYYHGNLCVSVSIPVAVQLADNEAILFQAQMEAGASALRREPSCHGEDGWEGPIFLPSTTRGKNRRGKLFFGRLRGDTKTFPFLPDKDSITIKPSTDSDVFQALADSHFVGKEWFVRDDATHAKSKTYKRVDVRRE